MNEKVTSAGAKAFLWATFGAEAQSALFELRWMICAMMIITIVDFYWGTRDSLQEGTSWHFSRAGRRTLTKIVEYLTYLLLGCVLGFAVTEPLGICDHVVMSAIGLGFGMVFDINSIIGHVLHVKGVKTTFNVWLFLLGLLKHHKEDVAEAIQDAVKEEKE